MAASCATLTINTTNNTRTALTPRPSVTSGIQAIETELHRAPGPQLRDPWLAEQEEWEGQRRLLLLRQDEEHRAVPRWTPAASATPDSPTGPIEPDSLAGDRWWQFEPPEKELALVEAGTPQEICRIIRESLANQLAAREEFLRHPRPGVSFQEFESGHILVPVNPTDDDVHPASAPPASSSDSLHMRQDSGSSSGSASSGVQSNGSSIRNAGLTPSTSRSSNSSRGAQSKYPQTPAQTSETNSSKSLWFIPHLSTLNANNNVMASRLIPPRVVQIRKLWKERMSEGTALMDESYFPPKCCLTEVPLKVIKGHLGFTQIALYKRKAREYSVPAGDRLFCPYPACSRWNPPSKMMVKYSMIRCKYCRGKICFICKGEAHAIGTDCPQDFALEATLRQARHSGWRRCYQCKNMVEKQSGCIHITCRCKAQFCYTCGEQWKTCTCTEEDETIRRQVLQQQEEDEAAEMAAAIADIERQQRRETEEAVARAEGGAREARIHEEEILREERLHAEYEQRWRKESEERAARVETERLRATAIELEELWIAFHRVHRMQSKVLFQRHREINTKLTADRETKMAHARAYSSAENTLRTQHTQAIQILQATHAINFQTLQTHQQREEDHYFTTLQARLQGEPNRDQRQYAVVAEMRAAHTEARNGLLAQQDAEASRTNAAHAQWLQEMRDSSPAAREAEAERERKDFERRGSRLVAERTWFDHLVGVRARMLEDLEAQMVSPPPTAAEMATRERGAG